MPNEIAYSTPQEEFWAGDFGSEYIGRNKSEQLLASNVNFFAKVLNYAGNLSSCVEFGANIGMNLRALQILYPKADFHGVEINSEAAGLLHEVTGRENVFCGSIFDYPITKQFDLSLIKGVLIHLNPDMLHLAYDKLYQSAKRWILISEYYNPSPVTITYRGHADKLFKRDFAGEMLELYSDLVLIDYGFIYRRDPAFPQDDITWFLMEKRV